MQFFNSKARVNKQVLKGLTVPRALAKKYSYFSDFIVQYYYTVDFAPIHFFLFHSQLIAGIWIAACQSVSKHNSFSIKLCKEVLGGGGVTHPVLHSLGQNSVNYTLGFRNLKICKYNYFYNIFKVQMGHAPSFINPYKRRDHYYGYF